MRAHLKRCEQFHYWGPQSGASNNRD